jgi:hypothetical protein
MYSQCDWQEQELASRSTDPSDVSYGIKGKFSLDTHGQSGWVSILYEFSPERYAEAEELADAGVDINGRKPIRLLKVSRNKDLLMIFPWTTLPGDDFLKAKYHRIEVIVLEGFDFTCPKDPDDVVYLLESLPKGFVKDPEYGLGLLKNYRFIIDAIEKVPGVKRLCLSRTRPTKLQGDTYVLNFSQYDAIRKAINNTHANAVKKAATDKRILSHNSLLHKLDCTTYPEQQRPYSDGTIYKVVEAGTGAKLSEKDQLAALSLVKQNKDNLGQSHPDKLMQLQREIELVTLKQLIEKMDSLLGKRIPEAKWQQFFVDHPFVLSLAFGLPIVVIHDQVSVGGRTFSGRGEKITDFLVKNGLGDNLALIEIKTPQTRLLGRQYRGGAYSASGDLVGCTTQVLDQRHKVQAELNTLKVNSRQFDLEAYAIRCLIIIGTTPDAPELRKSLELFRNNLHDVLVITFDELLEKLRRLHSFLSADADTQAADAMSSS